MSVPHPEKALLRSRLLTARAAVPARARRTAERAIIGRLLTLPEVGAARTLLGYAAFGSEASVDEALTALLRRGVGVFLPWVEGDDLGIARIRDLEADLVPGWRGVREPRASGRRPALPGRIDVAVVPGVAFDRQGRRLGYGGGHFDRLLARLRPDAAAVGVCFDVQVVDLLPREAHDVPVDVIVSDKEVIRP